MVSENEVEAIGEDISSLVIGEVLLSMTPWIRENVGKVKVKLKILRHGEIKIE